jgi:hypothetical protein
MLLIGRLCFKLRSSSLFFSFLSRDHIYRKIFFLLHILNINIFFFPRLKDCRLHNTITAPSFILHANSSVLFLQFNEIKIIFQRIKRKRGVWDDLGRSERVCWVRILSLCGCREDSSVCKSSEATSNWLKFKLVLKHLTCPRFVCIF